MAKNRMITGRSFFLTIFRPFDFGVDVVKLFSLSPEVPDTFESLAVIRLKINFNVQLTD
jgi:hypothetical protein